MKLGLFYAKVRADYNRLGASYWIRLLQMVPHYQKAGIEISVNNPFKPYDLAIFFRDPRPKYLYFMKHLKNISRHVYFDTCINLFDEHEELKRCDVGFLPRKIDDPYNSGHSSLKALVFASLHIPVIANKIASYVKLANYYYGVVFLEDHGTSIQQCIDAIRNRTLDNTRLKAFHSCENQATLMADFLSNNLDG